MNACASALTFGFSKLLDQNIKGIGHNLMHDKVKKVLKIQDRTYLVETQLYPQSHLPNIKT